MNYLYTMHYINEKWCVINNKTHETTLTGTYFQCNAFLVNNQQKWGRK